MTDNLLNHDHGPEGEERHHSLQPKVQNEYWPNPESIPSWMTPVLPPFLDLPGASPLFCWKSLIPIVIFPQLLVCQQAQSVEYIRNIL